MHTEKLIDSVIITNRHFRPNFVQNWLILSCKQHFRNGSMSKLILRIEFKGQSFLNFPQRKHYFGFGPSKLKASNSVNYFSRFLGKNIENCPPSKLFTSLENSGASILLRMNMFICLVWWCLSYAYVKCVALIFILYTSTCLYAWHVYAKKNMGNAIF